jgi:16S rRNA (cytidine1402-2'-O)-methyltransferase
MTAPEDPPGSEPELDPGLDPDILEELEFWGGGSDADDVAADDLEAAWAEPPERAEPGAGTDAKGAIVLVATPIGNLGDLSPRAIQSLEQADVIFCEDTRHSRRLLTHAGITGASLRSLHEHNEHQRIDEVLAAVENGKTVAVVSDAGMPGISDPGSRVVEAASRAGLTVTVIPGPSAALAALVVSGLPTERFVFEGFLPRAGKERRERLAAVGDEPRTTVLFEAPGRVAGTLGDLAEVCGGDRPVVVARELTKVHEEIWRGSLADGVVWAQARIRGEVVLVLGGAPEHTEPPVSDGVLQAAIAERLAAGERTRGAVDDVAELFGVSRRRVYHLALASREASPTPPEPSE